MLVNIHFNNINSKKVNLLYLFTKLRWYAKDRGGYYNGFEFTKNEKYNLLPSLIKLGWVTDKKVNSYRKLCFKKGVIMLWAAIEEKDIESIDAFKGFLIASTEAAALKQRNNIKEGKAFSYDIRSKVNDKRHWTNESEAPYWLATKKMNGYQYLGRVYNGQISNVTGLSERTITRWRKYSKNEYRLRTYTQDYPYIKGRTVDQCYKSKNGKFVTKDLTILTNVRVFMMSHTCKESNRKKSSSHFPTTIYNSI